MSISLDIKINDVVVRNKAKFRYAMMMPQDRMLFLPLDLGQGHEFMVTEKEFEVLLNDRQVRTYDVVRNASGEIVNESPADIDPRKEDSKKVKDARSLFFFLKKWYATRTSKSRVAIDDFVMRHAAEARRAGHDWQPSFGAMQRRINLYPDIEQLTARFLISASGESKKQHWHPAVARALEDIIEFHWEKNTPGRSHSDTYAEFDARFTAAAMAVARDGFVEAPLKKPSRETVRNYVNDAECYETYSRKFDKHRADARFKGNVHPIPATKLLEVVLIDSTVLDAWCVLDDETMQPLGRPTLTIAIDLFTRMILAIIITYEPPSLYTAMACLKRVNMSKHDINERWPNIERVSDGWGKPTMVVVDNELAQVGKSYQSACEDAKINVRWAPVARPQYKAVAERFFLTVKHILIDKLPGGLPYKPDTMKALGIDPSKTATITLSKMTELLNLGTNDVYHYDKHSTINMPPALAWEISKKKWKRAFIGDVDFLDKAFGALGHGLLTTSGIRFENMFFHDPNITSSLLDDMAHMALKRTRRKSLLSTSTVKVMFKYNPADVSAIQVWNFKIKDYVRLPNAAGEAANGLSIWHWRILRIWTDQNNLLFVTPEQQLAARRRLRETIEESMPREAFATIKRSRRIMHEPSQIMEGRLANFRQAVPTVAGMASDDMEIEVGGKSAPSGNRIPAKGQVRGRTRHKAKSARPQKFDGEQTTSPPAERRLRQKRITDIVAKIAGDQASSTAPDMKSAKDFDTRLDDILRKAKLVGKGMRT